MRKSIQFYGLLLTILSICFVPLMVAAEYHHSSGKTYDNFFGGARLVLTPFSLCENVGVSALAEAGSNNYRFNGTLGVFACDQYRFKFSGEYLTQRIHYKFSSGKSRHWVQQYALGSTYQYHMDDCGCLKGIQLNGCYSQAKNHHLKEEACHDEKQFVDRRIAGSWNMDVEAGLVIAPWQCANLILSAGYDQVRYRREFFEKLRLSGAVATVKFEQQLGWGLALDVIAEFKRPYNYLEGLLSWGDRFSCGDLSLGVYAAHTWGKYHLPSSTAVGGELRWSWGVDSSCYASCAPCDPCASICSCNREELVAWLNRPAVYIPEVLAIAEQKPFHPCIPPTSKKIDEFVNTNCGFHTLDVSDNFDTHGQPVKFSATGLPPGSSISKNGKIKLFNDCRSADIPVCSHAAYLVNVTATTPCGSTTQSFAILNKIVVTGSN